MGKDLEKDTQQSTSTLIINSPLKKETDSENSDEDDNIESMKEVPEIPPDLVIQGESSEIEVHSRLYSQNRLQILHWIWTNLYTPFEQKGSFVPKRP